jgi:hypothetical protein
VAGADLRSQALLHSCGCERKGKPGRSGTKTPGVPLLRFASASVQRRGGISLLHALMRPPYGLQWLAWSAPSVGY